MIINEDVRGHWVRRWIKAPGFEDHTTRVHWIQVGSVYADVRIPAERPDLGDATALAALSTSALLKLCEAEGFAGTTTLSGDTCTWHREVNFHGVPDSADVGRISFDENEDMIEAGVLSEYTELWTRAVAPETSAYRLSGQGFQGVMATMGDGFVLAIDRPGKEATAPIITALKAGERSGIETLFDSIYAKGAWDGATAKAQIATQPLSEGKDLLTIDGDRAVWHRIDFAGTHSRIALILEDVTQ